MGQIISIQDAPGTPAEQSATPQAIVNKLNVMRERQFSRRFAVKMFFAGLPFRSAARRHPEREDGLSRDIRAGRDVA
jgi:hypothetical protein